eukprot:6188096-Pleurochrysis_carterae.AAC.3
MVLIYPRRSSRMMYATHVPLELAAARSETPNSGIQSLTKWLMRPRFCDVTNLAPTSRSTVVRGLSRSRGSTLSTTHA